MRAGLLKHRVVIRSLSTGRDSVGEPLKLVTNVMSIWADVGFASGRERWANKHTVNNYDAVVSVRYRKEIREDMQVVHDDRILDIKAIIDPLGNKSELKLLCVDHG